MYKHLLFLLFIILGYANGIAQPVYNDVAPIFYNRCAHCHNNNSHAPPLLNYTQTYAKRSLINTHLTSGYMPPWPPDTTYTRFLHEELISVSEKAAILNWISNGAPAGDTTIAPPIAPVYPQYLLSGTPDAVLQIPTFSSNASTTDSYVCFALPTGLTQDRILRAYEIVAGNPSIVHHVVVNVDTTGTVNSNLSGGCYNITGQFSIGGYAPGSPPTVFPGVAPLKAGIRIKSGSKLILQIHYPSGTAGQMDSTKIRLYYYPAGDTGIRPVLVSTLLTNWGLYIPANTVKTFTDVYPNSGTLPVSLSMYAAFPHSHKLATSIVNYAYTSTDTIPLVRINNWDFNWQGYYTFKNLVKVPAGHKLFSAHVYDNTVNNPNNPNNPPVNVVAGTNTTNEMLFDSYQYLVYQSGDENIDVSALLANDTLLMAGIKESSFTSPYLRTYAYPNPFENNVKIAYTLEAPSKVVVEVYSVYGVLVKTIQSAALEMAGRHELAWDGKNAEGTAVSAGNYFYIIKAGSQQNSGKLSLQR